MIRIAYVIDQISTPGAGTERQLLQLLAHLDRSRFAPELVCLRSSPWLESARLDVPVRVLDVSRFDRPQVLSAVARLARRFRASDPRIVQTLFSDADVVGVLGARLADVPVRIASRRNLGYEQGRVRRSLTGLLRPLTTHYLANSHAAARATVRREHVAPGRIRVIHNGVDEAFLAPAAEGAREARRSAWGIAASDTVVGAVANLRRLKGIDTLIRAAALLVPGRPSLRFVVMGEGGDRARLEGLVASEGLGGRFLLPGATEDVRGGLAGLDVAVLPSTSEGFSNAVLESMAAGLPVVSTDVGGAPEVITHGENGWLCPPGRPERLAACLGEVLDDPAEAARRGAAAHETIREHFSLRACVRAHEDLYETLAARPATRFQNAAWMSAIAPQS